MLPGENHRDRVLSRRKRDALLGSGIHGRREHLEAPTGVRSKASAPPSAEKSRSNPRPIPAAGRRDRPNRLRSQA